MDEATRVADATKEGEGAPELFYRRLFISYETRDAKHLAIRAKRIFSGARHEAWVWCKDSQSGAYIHEEISGEIQACDRFVYICTANSDLSRGQRFERAQALEWGPVIDVIAFDRQHVSSVLCHISARITTPHQFDATCNRLAKEFLKSPIPPRTVVVERYRG